MKKIILLLMCAALLTVGISAFDDITDDTTSLAVYTLESMGLVTGTGENTYSPELTLTRAQVCTLMIRTMGLEKSVSGYVNQNLFNDVRNSMWHAGYVNLAYNEGIINGYGNGYFGPDDEVTYGQFITIILRMLGYSENEIGKKWPADYIIFAGDLGIDENVSLDAYESVSRGDAAILLYNALMAKGKGSANEYYRTVNGYSSSVTALVLDNGVEDSNVGDLYVCVIDNNSVSMKYYTQENTVPDKFVDCIGKVLLNASGKVIGFIPSSDESKEIVVDSAKPSGITDIEGNTYKVSSSVSVINGSGIYPFGTTGYIKVNDHSNKVARFYFADDGSVTYIYLASNADSATTTVAVASSDAPAADFEKAFGLTSGSYNIVKNGGRTDTAALTIYDVARYDTAAKTLFVADYKLSGYITSASPSIVAAETIVVSGCEMKVLQCAWDSLADFSFGSYVTVLLTDNNYVAAVLPAEELECEMYGVLSKDGNSVTLLGSGLTMKPNDIDANVSANGSLVGINTSSEDIVVCYAVGRTILRDDVVYVKENTVNGIPFAAGCSIFEWGGSGYVYSLDGVFGESSDNLSKIYWADTLDYKYISYYHKNSLGLIDILVLTEVTGNYYDYGLLKLHKDESGFSVGNTYTNGLSVSNASYPGGSQKYICNISTGGGYAGVAFASRLKSYGKVAAVTRLTYVNDADTKNFVLTDDGDWYFDTEAGRIPVSENVQVYIEATNKWSSGESGILSALSLGYNITVLYDREVGSGAQVRIIVLNK